MATKVSVRLDDESRQLLEELKLRLGWSYARIIREGILLMASERGFYEPEKTMGTDKFGSGISDLDANSFHLKDSAVNSTDHPLGPEK